MIVPQKPNAASSSPGGTSAREAKGPEALVGFLTVVEHADAGFFGGYLILNAAARPVEFHCSAPVKANRAQEILYGPTLRPYLCGELIAATLLAKAKNQASLICTDCPDAMAARSGIKLPMALIGIDGPAEAGPPAPHFLSGRAVAAETFSHGEMPVAVAADYATDQRLVLARLQELGTPWDLSEPFERIRLAMDEAQRGAQS